MEQTSSVLRSMRSSKFELTFAFPFNRRTGIIAELRFSFVFQSCIHLQQFIWAFKVDSSFFFFACKFSAAKMSRGFSLPSRE
ncbi:hypothetical protein V6N13_099255 [Hibiscus sabdariffa]